MLYCTYDQYAAAGGTLDEAAFAPLAARASRLIDRMTFGRAEGHAAACEGCAEALADACIQIDRRSERRAERLHAARRVQRLQRWRVHDLHLRRTGRTAGGRGAGHPRQHTGQ